MRILSTDFDGAAMDGNGEGAARISKAAIKELVHDGSGIILNDRAAEKLATILEERARDMAAHAVANARRRNRTTILEEDVEDYTMKRGD